MDKRQQYLRSSARPMQLKGRVKRVLVLGGLFGIGQILRVSAASFAPEGLHATYEFKAPQLLAN